MGKRYYEVRSKNAVFYRSTAKAGAECYLRLLNGRTIEGHGVYMTEMVTNIPRDIGILKSFVFATV
jgi:hypothetical protein